MATTENMLYYLLSLFGGKSIVLLFIRQRHKTNTIFLINIIIIYIYIYHIMDNLRRTLGAFILLKGAFKR